MRFCRSGEADDQPHAMGRDEWRLFVLGPVSKGRRREVLQLNDQLLEKRREVLDRKGVIGVWLDACRGRHDPAREFPDERFRRQD